jgi:hypothetical protein
MSNAIVKINEKLIPKGLLGHPVFTKLHISVSSLRKV